MKDGYKWNKWADVPDDSLHHPREPNCCWKECRNKPAAHAVFTRNNKSLDYVLSLAVGGELFGKTHADVCESHLPLLLKLADDALIVPLGTCEAGC